VQVANGWSRDTNEVLVIGLHMVGKDWVWTCLQSSLRFKWSKKEPRNIFYFSYFSFLFFFYFFFFFSFFPSYFSSLYFFILQFLCSSKLFRQHSTCYSSPPPCLNDCSSSSIEVRGPMAAKEVQNPCIPLENFWNLQVQSSMSKLEWSLMSPSICYMSWNLARKSSENSSKDHPYSIWVVVKEVITKRCFGLGWMPSEVCEISNVETHNAWTRMARTKKIRKGMTSFLVSYHRNHPNPTHQDISLQTKG
jgi:hypothetical protein